MDKPHLIQSREAANLRIESLKAAFEAERDLSLLPLRLSYLAWTIFQCACLPEQSDAAVLAMAAVNEAETAVRIAAPSSFGAFQCRFILANILLGRIAYDGTLAQSPSRAETIAAAAALARAALDECVAQNLDGEHLLSAVDLIGLISQARYEFDSDPSGLQEAIELLSKLSEAVEGDNPARWHIATSTAQLHYSHFERSGDPEDLERAIGIGREMLREHSEASLKPVGTPAANEADVRLVTFSLSNALASRAELRLHKDDAPNNASVCPQVEADAREAVELARHLVATANPRETDVATAANALGFALRIQGRITKNSALLGEAVHHFMRGAEQASEDSALQRLLINNGATLLGELHDDIHEMRHDDAALSDVALNLLSNTLPPFLSNEPMRGISDAGLLFNYANVIISRRLRSGRQDLTGDAVAALTRCLPLIPEGHPRRSQVLSLFAIGLAQPECAARFSDAAGLCLDAAMEAEAIHQACGSIYGWSPDCVPVALALWQQVGRDLGTVESHRAAAVTKLIGTVPDAAMKIAVRRAGESLLVGALQHAEHYARIACAARDRAMLMANDPEMATEFAIGQDTAEPVRRVALAIAGTAPERAAFLLERAQGSIIARLQLSIADPSTTIGPKHPDVQKFIDARSRMVDLITQRRTGTLAATPEAFRAAETMLETAMSAVRALPGMDDFLAPIAEPAALRALADRLVYVATGDDAGVAIIFTGDRKPYSVTLPGLARAAVLARLSEYRAALTQLDHFGAEFLDEFQTVLESTVGWLSGAVEDKLAKAFGAGPFSLVPCGILALLPWGSVTMMAPAAYTPSVQTHVRLPRPGSPVPILLVSGTEARGQADLPMAEQVADWLRSLTGGAVFVLSGGDATPERVLAEAERHQTILFYAHGVVDETRPLSSGILLNGDTRLDVGTIMTHPTAFAGRTIVLAACSQGRVDGRIPSEMLSPATAFLAAGATAVVAPTWPVEAFSAQVVAMTFLEGLLSNLPLSDALITAQSRVRLLGRVQNSRPHLAGLSRGTLRPQAAESSGLDFARPFFSSAFCLYGRSK